MLRDYRFHDSYQYDKTDVEGEKCACSSLVASLQKKIIYSFS